jgi:hypothetical protein
VAGFILVASSFSQVFYYRPVLFAAIAAIGTMVVIRGYKLMRQLESRSGLE